MALPLTGIKLLMYFQFLCEKSHLNQLLLLYFCDAWADYRFNRNNESLANLNIKGNATFLFEWQAQHHYYNVIRGKKQL